MKLREESEGKMTDISAHQLCWFGLGWAAELPGCSPGTNGPCACAGPGRWELLPQLAVCNPLALV